MKTIDRKITRAEATKTRDDTLIKAEEERKEDSIKSFIASLDTGFPDAQSRLNIRAKLNSLDVLLDALKSAQVRIFMLEGNSEEYDKAGAAIARAEDN